VVFWQWPEYCTALYGAGSMHLSMCLSQHGSAEANLQHRICCCGPGWQRRRNGMGTRPRNVETMGREYLFASAIFSHIFACCSLNFHSLSLCCLHTIKNFIKQKTHRPILHIRLAYVISKMANFHVCCDKQQ